MIRVFSYGSNGTAQLRARVQNALLQSKPARLENFARIFCLRSGGWGGGGARCERKQYLLVSPSGARGFYHLCWLNACDPPKRADRLCTYRGRRGVAGPEFWLYNVRRRGGADGC